MKVELKKLPQSKIEISFEIPWEKFQNFLDKATADLSRGFKMPGFRPGKLPREMAEKEIGQDNILSRAAELAVKKEYPGYVLEQNLEVVGLPQIEILKLAPNNPFCFRVRVDVLPEIKLPDYKKIAPQVEKKETSVSEDEINDSLKWLQQSRAEFQDLPRQAQNGDWLEIEYQSAQINNSQLIKDKVLLGKGHFSQGFERNLQGVKAGQEKEFSVDFPADWPRKEVAGKKIDFKVKIKKVQQMELPELDDEFAKKLGSFKDLPSLRESLREGIKKEKEFGEQQRRRDEILQRIAKLAELPVPESLFESEKENMFKEFKERVEKELGVSLQEYLGQIKKTEEEMKESFAEAAKKRIENFLVLKEVGKKEKITVSEEKVKEAVNKFLAGHPQAEKVRKEVDPEKLREYHKSVIYNEKVMQLLENL